METKGNPWGMNASARLDWAADLPFEVKVVDGPLDDVEWLFWVGCAGAYEDRAKKTTAGRRRAAAPGGGQLRRARRGRDLHR